MDAIKDKGLSDEPGLQTVCVDFDGVVHAYSGWNGGALGEAIPAGLDLLRMLIANNYRVMIFSSRFSDDFQPSGLSLVHMRAVYDWLWDRLGIETVQRLGFTGSKIPAVAYVDDRAVPWHGDAVDVFRIVNELAVTVPALIQKDAR